MESDLNVRHRAPARQKVARPPPLYADNWRDAILAHRPHGIVPWA